MPDFRPQPPSSVDTRFAEASSSYNDDMPKHLQEAFLWASAVFSDDLESPAADVLKCFSAHVQWLIDDVVDCIERENVRIGLVPRVPQRRFYTLNTSANSRVSRQNRRFVFFVPLTMACRDPETLFVSGVCQFSFFVAVLPVCGSPRPKCELT